MASQRQMRAPRGTGAVVKMPVPATALGLSSYGTCMRPRARARADDDGDKIADKIAELRDPAG